MSYRAAHQKVSRKRGKAVTHACVSCHEQAQEWAFCGDADRAERSEYGLFSMNELDYRPLCRRCHALERKVPCVAGVATRDHRADSCRACCNVRTRARYEITRNGLTIAYQPNG